MTYATAWLTCPLPEEALCFWARSTISLTLTSCPRTACGLPSPAAAAGWLASVPCSGAAAAAVVSPTAGCEPASARPLAVGLCRGTGPCSIVDTVTGAAIRGPDSPPCCCSDPVSPAGSSSQDSACQMHSCRQPGSRQPAQKLRDAEGQPCDLAQSASPRRKDTADLLLLWLTERVSSLPASESSALLSATGEAACDGGSEAVCRGTVAAAPTAAALRLVKDGSSSSAAAPLLLDAVLTTDPEGEVLDTCTNTHKSLQPSPCQSPMSQVRQPRLWACKLDACCRHHARLSTV